MKPDVNQHLQSMAKAMTEIVLPELQDKPFALEQASLVVASLKLLVEVQEHQFAYVRQEFDDLRSLLGAWFVNHPQSLEPAFWQALHAGQCDAGTMGFGELRDTVSREKSSLRELMERCPLPAGSPVAPLLDLYIERQLARETAWLRLTGFIPEAASVPAIATVLEAQRQAPL
ncbi:MAG TPA: hypothetical protein VFY31_07040 [Macromonas sp.]|nr:hypothetical protein [Macromonas sp.]